MKFNSLRFACFTTKSMLLVEIIKKVYELLHADIAIEVYKFEMLCIVYIKEYF